MISLDLVVVQNSWLWMLIITFHLQKSRQSCTEPGLPVSHCFSLSAKAESIKSWSRGSSGTCADSQSWTATPGAIANAESWAPEQSREGAFSSRTSCSGGRETSNVEGSTVRQMNCHYSLHYASSGKGELLHVLESMVLKMENKETSLCHKLGEVVVALWFCQTVQSIYCLAELICFWQLHEWDVS